MNLRISLFLLIMLSVLSCQRSEYSKLVKEEMNKNIVNDSLLFGMKLGDGRQKFYDICWKLNKEKIIKEGPENNFVEYQLPVDEEDASISKITMLFYGIFNDDKIMTGFDMKFYYNGWSIWNKSLQAESLLPVVRDSLLKWYPGNNFISHKLRNSGNDILVKVDGNRRIIIEPIEGNREINARIDDLRFTKGFN